MVSNHTPRRSVTRTPPSSKHNSRLLIVTRWPIKKKKKRFVPFCLLMLSWGRAHSVMRPGVIFRCADVSVDCRVLPVCVDRFLFSLSLKCVVLLSYVSDLSLIASAVSSGYRSGRESYQTSRSPAGKSVSSLCDLDFPTPVLERSIYIAKPVYTAWATKEGHGYGMSNNKRKLNTQTHETQ